MKDKPAENLFYKNNLAAVFEDTMILHIGYFQCIEINS
jgi:hypothetical protein